MILKLAFALFLIFQGVIAILNPELLRKAKSKTSIIKVRGDKPLTAFELVFHRVLGVLCIAFAFWLLHI